jgi:putative ubiquitin-RnfH superfamily antitoxin RatB of RatAB toxin-antitoxin module
MPMVEVIYATIDSQQLLSLNVSEQATIEDCIIQSGLMVQFPEIDLSVMKVGVFSQVKPLDYVVNEGDRVEIYRPLIADPKVVRRQKAEAAKQ